MSGVALDALHAAATTLQNLAFAWLIGAVLVGGWIGTAGYSKQHDLHRDFTRSMVFAAATSIVAQIVLLWLEAAVMADVPNYTNATPVMQIALRRRMDVRLRGLRSDSCLVGVPAQPQCEESPGRRVSDRTGRVRLFP